VALPSQTIAPTPLFGQRAASGWQASISPAQWAADLDSPLRIMAAYVAIAFVFVQFSKVHEILSFTMNVRTYLVDLVGIPAIIALLMAGGLPRTLRWRAAKYWLAFVVWMLLAVPFSSWKGGSTHVFLEYLRTQVVLLFLIAGCVVSWQDFRRLIKVIIAATVFNVAAGLIIKKASIDNRADFGDITFGNSNDFAAVLQLLLPIVLILVFSPKTSAFIRVLACGLFILGEYVSLSTGSRASLIAMICSGLFLFLRGKASQKVGLILMVPIVAVGSFAILPGDVVSRLGSMVSKNDNTAENNGAVASSVGREYLLRQSLIMTLQHPLFGVGTGEFQNVEGAQARSRGEGGLWHETHNAYTQVSSEIGIPAAIFFIGAILSTFLLFNRVYKKAQQHPELKDSKEIAVIALCLMMSMVGFCTNLCFLSLAYTFFFPALTGIAIVFARLVEQEWNVRLAPGQG
jgi:O-antigen ligase